MTDANKYNPYPHEAVVRCPRCDGRALFRHAFALLSRRQWNHWESRLWPCARAIDWEGRAHWAPGDPPPSWSGWIVVQQDPTQHRWKKPPDGHRRTDEGIVQCSECVGRFAHTLRWPDDAWYRFELRRGVLWAWSRDYVLALIEYLESDRRDASAHGGYGLFLHHVPSKFLGAKDRDDHVKRLRQLLAELD